jgi:Delta24-sterol reductase
MIASPRYIPKKETSSKSRHFSHGIHNSAALDGHNAVVKTLSATVRQFYDRRQKFRISHGSTNSTRSSASKGRNIVDISSLSNVLQIDTNTRTALVEPNVPMDRLVEETMKYGLVPPVVMEFPGITVGGGFAGTSGESSSFKHGFFNRTINRIEMVLANGDVVTCSDHEMSDLFHGAAGAVGSLGVTTLVELQLTKAKKYVETTYHPIVSMSEAVQKIEIVTADPDLDYVDGIIFSKNKGAIITGRLTDNPKETIPIQHFSDAADPWFYLHVEESITKQAGPSTEAIPLAEYLFRYDRGGFWVGASAFDYFNMPFNAFTRWWLDDFLHTRMMYTALHASGQSKKYVVQDLALPYSTAGEFVDYTDQALGIYPLWLCPLRQSPLPTMHPHFHETEADGKALKPMLNIGLWGYGPSRHDDFLKVNRELEHKLRELGGMKWLYAQTFYTEDEFWRMYDRDWYNALREKYCATSLPSAYEKVKLDVEAERRAGSPSLVESILSTWPISGFYGIKMAIDSGTYLEARASAWKSARHTERLSPEG